MVVRLPGAKALAAWRRRLVERWLARHAPPEPTRITVHRRRLFILPSGLGYTFGLTIALLLLGALNYGTSLGFAVTFLLAGSGALGMLHTYRNLEGVTFAFAPAPAVFVGDTAAFPVTVEAPDGPRWALELRMGGEAVLVATAWPAAPAHATVPVVATGRGRLRPPRLTAATQWPLALFRVWSWLHPAVETIVYPAAIDHGHPLPPPVPGGDHDRGGGDDDDFAGLREYRPGDPPRRIAWKALARHDELHIKAFEATPEGDRWLDWQRLGELEPEARLEQLCRWVLQADVDGHGYGLALPGLRIPPATGPDHRTRCLEALALYREDAQAS